MDKLFLCHNIDQVEACCDAFDKIGLEQSNYLRDIRHGFYGDSYPYYLLGKNHYSLAYRSEEAAHYLDIENYTIIDLNDYPQSDNSA